VSLSEPALFVETGGEHSCAVLESSEVACWGANDFGQLGIGTHGGNRTTPTSVVGYSGAVELALGAQHSCVLTRLGTGSTTFESEPAPVTGLSRVDEIDAGMNHTCAALDDGTAWCWGDNSDGALGDDTGVDRALPVRVEGLSRVVGISANRHTCATLADGTARCWGANGSAQLGDGTVIRRLTPAEPVDLQSVVSIAAGWSHSCALVASGAVYCWGVNEYGQLGDGSLSSSFEPVAVDIQ
jgi:alpha-tubulin suppressor-like RCC1 family protein